MKLRKTQKNSEKLRDCKFLYFLVGRFVKHTGYGNAAGLLARRGLLMGGHGDNDYSSTDEDSETEEYSEKAHL